MPSVLIIDDEAALIGVVSRFLERGGFRVIAATSGPEGLQKALVESPDVTMVDVMMPEMDGYEVCRRLRADPRTARARILVLTARGQLIDKRMALRAGADDHATKPFNGKELVQQVKDLMEAKPQLETALGCQILVLRLKEGAGATMLACNLGACLAAEKGCLTAVADMVVPGGQVGERLGLSAPALWLESAATDGNGLAACTVRHHTGLFALPTPSAPRSGKVDPKEVPGLLKQLRGWCDFVVLDAPRNLGALAPVCVGSSWLVLLLLTPDPAVLRTARSSVAALARLGNKGLRVWPVLNMVDTAADDVQRQVEKALRLPVAAVLPWSPQECARAVSDHNPEVLSCPDSLLAKRITSLSRQIVQAMDTRVYQGSWT